MRAVASVTLGVARTAVVWFALKLFGWVGLPLGVRNSCRDWSCRGQNLVVCVWKCSCDGWNGSIAFVCCRGCCSSVLVVRDGQLAVRRQVLMLRLWLIFGGRQCRNRYVLFVRDGLFVWMLDMLLLGRVHVFEQRMFCPSRHVILVDVRDLLRFI